MHFKSLCTGYYGQHFLWVRQVTLTHETSPEGEVVLVAHCVDDGQGVEDLLEYEKTIFEVLVALEPLGERFA